MRTHLLTLLTVALGCGGVAVGDGTTAFAEGPDEAAIGGPASGPAPGPADSDLPRPGGAGPKGEPTKDGSDSDPPPPEAPPSTTVVLRGAMVVGQGVRDLAFDLTTAKIVADADASATVEDVAGKWLVPAFIDSHVHLAFFPVGDDLAQAGVVAAVDLAAPARFVGTTPATGARVLWAGPMVTPPLGYPTQSWGRNGYGAECEGISACQAVVERLVDAGAQLIKVPVGQGPDHPADVLAAVVAAAHARRVPVTSHSVTDAAASNAAAAGVDLLAHTPTQRLSDETVSAWSGKAVISTLGAFGGTADTVENLRRLRAAGTTVLYGTDLGNTRTVGIDGREIALLVEAGLDGAAILAAGTHIPATFWGLHDLGTLLPGNAASLLVLDADPLVTPSTLAASRQVWINGVRQR